MIFDTVFAEVLNVEVGTGFDCHGFELTRPKSNMTGATNLFVSVGKTLPSTACVSLLVKVFNTVRQLTVYLIDSDAPRLIARPTLEEWGIVCDIRNKTSPAA